MLINDPQWMMMTGGFSHCRTSPLWMMDEVSSWTWGCWMVGWWFHEEKRGDFFTRNMGIWQANLADITGISCGLTCAQKSWEMRLKNRDISWYIGYGTRRIRITMAQGEYCRGAKQTCVCVLKYVIWKEIWWLTCWCDAPDFQTNPNHGLF